MSFGIIGSNIGASSGGPGATLYGETPETTWRNTSFKVKLMPLTDLADRGIKKVDRVPTDDLLDDFKVGDQIGGIGKIDKQSYEGKISRILKNGNGKGFRVFILNKKNEKEIEVLPSSLVFINPIDRNREDMEQAADDARNSDVRNRKRVWGDNQGDAQYNNSMMGENRKLKHLLEFHEFFRKD